MNTKACSCLLTLVGSALFCSAAANAQVKTLDLKALDQLGLTIVASSETQAARRCLPPMVTLAHRRTQSGQWEGYIKGESVPCNPKEESSFVIVDLKIAKLPKKALRIEPKMIALVDPSTATTHTSQLWTPPAGENAPDPEGAWSLFSCTMDVSPSMISFSYPVLVVSEPISEQQRKETGLIAQVPAGQMTVSGKISGDTVRLGFIVPRLSAQRSFDLMILGRLIGQVQVGR